MPYDIQRKMFGIKHIVDVDKHILGFTTIEIVYKVIKGYS